MVGAITNSVRNSARLTITLLGGVVCKPIAVRRSDSTTMMRTKLVIMMRMAGAIDRIVISAMICIILSVNRPVPDTLTESGLAVVAASAAVPAAAFTASAANATSGTIRS